MFFSLVVVAVLSTGFLGPHLSISLPCDTKGYSISIADDRQEFLKPCIQTNKKNKDHVLPWSETRKNVYILAVLLFRRIFSPKFFCMFFFLRFKCSMKKHSERLSLLCACASAHNWGEYCLIGGAKVKLILLRFDDGNEEWEKMSNETTQNHRADRNEWPTTMLQHSRIVRFRFSSTMQRNVYQNISAHTWAVLNAWTRRNTRTYTFLTFELISKLQEQ